jgi:hypothetical protein
MALSLVSMKDVWVAEVRIGRIVPAEFVTFHAFASLHVQEALRKGP